MTLQSRKPGRRQPRAKVLGGSEDPAAFHGLDMVQGTESDGQPVDRVSSKPNRPQIESAKKKLKAVAKTTEVPEKKSKGKCAGTGGQRKPSPAFRKRVAEAMRVRWADGRRPLSDRPAPMILSPSRPYRSRPEAV